MNYYLVGTPESVFASNLFSSPKQKKFTKEEIERNLKGTDGLKIFTSLEDAREYARSLRICRASHVVDPSRKKIAPVVHVEVYNHREKYEVIRDKHFEDVTVKEYEGLHSNYSNGEHKSTISFIPNSDLNVDLADFNLNAVEFPDTNYPITKFNQTSLSFFRALNPASNNSGIVYRLAGNSPCQGKEMLDSTVGDNISRAFKSDLDYLSGLCTTFNILVGTHFDIYLKGRHNNQGGAKGVLDFLILPLLTRKLIADTFLDEQKENTFTNVLAWAIAVPIEIARFGAGLFLTLLLSPIVALVHLIKACLPTQEPITEPSIAPTV